MSRISEVIQALTACSLRPDRIVATIVMTLLLTVQSGCFLWSEDADADDICAGIQHAFADDFFPNVTREQCDASPRGDWDGKCYCHGTD